MSEEAHSSVGKALRVLGVEPLLVPCDDHRLTGDGPAGRARRPRRGAPTSSAVVATAGTTNAGIIDDLAGRRPRWRAERSPVVPRRRGLRRAPPSSPPRSGTASTASRWPTPSWSIPHKWLFAPFDCAALIYREPNLAKAVHTQDASYLDVLHSDAPDEWNPSDYAYHLTRRARGLPLWFSLAVNGTDAYRDAIETVLAVAQQAADLIERAPYLELVRRPELSVVLFRRTGWDRADYESWSARLLADQIGFVAPTTWEGSRSAVWPSSIPDTTMAIIEEICHHGLRGPDESRAPGSAL